MEGGVTLVSALELTDAAWKLMCRYFPLSTVSVERKRGEVKVGGHGQAQKERVA